MNDSVRGTGHFGPLIAVILSAVSVVTATFGLFNSILKELMPQVEGAAQTVSFVSFGTVIVLLALTLLIRKRLRVFAQIALAITSIVLLAVAAVVYLAFTDLVRDRVYLYPPGSGSVSEQRPYVSGAYHEQGRIRAAGMDLATGVSKHGGPDMVNAHQLLWTSEARSAVVGQFVRYYMALAFLMTTALYIAAIAIWRTLAGQQTTRRSSQ
ncbi:MAG: hypothetical protein QM740_21260 [Acidovorax sp.]